MRKAVAASQLYTRRQMTLTIPGKGEVTADITVTPIEDTQQSLVEFVPMDRYLRIDRDAAIKEHHDVTRQMVRGFAHEVKNPLGGIKGSAQLLERELPDESLQEYTNIIIEETDRLTLLVDRMLGPNTPPKLRLITIHEVLERAAKLIELESDDALIVVRDYDPSIPEISIDPELMVQALLNVVRNAMQCLEGTPHPFITLVTRIERQFTIAGERHRTVLKVEVCDNGPGIPPEIQEHLFYPMITGRPGGTGLGLTFAQSIISQHKGMIEFESEPGDTIFRILIPLE
ncbi:MAG: two-component system nitrogen regulation sensor histidine kinase GlnL [Candidatus Azotimanducaceae bacterium]